MVCERREGGQGRENERGWGKELGRENGKGGEERKRSSKNKSKKNDNMDGKQDLKNMSTMACSKNEILLMNEIDHKNTMAMKYSHMDETNIL